MDARRVGLVALATFAGALVGGALVWDGGATPLGAAQVPVLVRVSNEGPHDAQVTIDLSSLGGQGGGHTVTNVIWGTTRDITMGSAEPPASVFVGVEWSARGLAGTGDRRALVEEDTCASGETAVVIFRFRTEQGVVFEPTRRECL